MVEIIAEAAAGFQGDLKLSELLIKGASGANADSIKFQLLIADELAIPDYEHYSRWKSFEMPEESWKKVIEMAHDKNLKIYFDVFGFKGLEIAKKYCADGIKVHATDFYNSSFMNEIFNSGFEKLFISTGGIPIEDLEKLVNEKKFREKKGVIFMFGFQGDPTPLENNNILRIKSLKEKFPEIKFGFMDHAKGDLEDTFYLSPMALSFEVECVEKHITLDPLLELRSRISALPPEKFKEYTRIMRKFETALGSPELKLTPIEEEYRKKVIKTIVALEDINEGTILNELNIGLKRIGGKFDENIHFTRLENAIGKKLKKDIFKHEPLTKDII